MMTNPFYVIARGCKTSWQSFEWCRAGGDAFVGGGLWVQGLYNYSKQDASTGSTGFEANAEGIGFGIDGKINDNWSVGIGYGYLHTDAEAGLREDYQSHTGMVRAKYNF